MRFHGVVQSLKKNHRDNFTLPFYLYLMNPIQICTRCRKFCHNMNVADATWTGLTLLGVSHYFIVYSCVNCVVHVIKCVDCQ